MNISYALTNPLYYNPVYFIHERRRFHQILLQDPLFTTELSRGPNCFWFNHHLRQVWDFSQNILRPLILHQSSFIRLLTRNPFCLPQIHPLSSQWHPMSPFSNSSVILFGGLWSFQFHQDMPPPWVSTQVPQNIIHIMILFNPFILLSLTLIPFPWISKLFQINYCNILWSLLVKLSCYNWGLGTGTQHFLPQ